MARGALSPLASAARAAFVRRRRIAIPAATSSWTILAAGREGRGVELGERTLGRADAPDQKEAPDPEIPRIRGVHPVAVLFERCLFCVERLRRPAQVLRDERDVGLSDNATYLARATASFGPKARAARRRRVFARRDRRAAPSRCSRSARAWRRRAGRPASMRRGDRPPRSARAAAVISESIGILVTLVTPSVRIPGAKLIP